MLPPPKNKEEEKMDHTPYCFLACYKKKFGPTDFFYGMGATIRIGREIQCLPYAGFFVVVSI